MVLVDYGASGKRGECSNERGVPVGYEASGNREECSSERVCFRGDRDCRIKHETKCKPLISLKTKYEE